MRVDLSHLLREEPSDDLPFKSIREAKEYLIKYFLSFICIELGGLPREQWERTLTTWLRIIALGMALSEKDREARKTFYREKGFDLTMEGITEDIVGVYKGLWRLGLLKEKNPKELMRVALELAEGEKELLRREGIEEEKLAYIREFLSRL